MLNQNKFLGSYSSKYKSQASHKSQSTDSSRIVKSPTKLKLPEISSTTDHSSLPSSHRKLFKNSSIIKPINDKSLDYEKAIKEHLGIKNLSKESSFSSIPIAKAKLPWATPRHKLKSLDFSSLALIEQEETRIEEIIRKKNVSQIRSHKKSNSIKQNEDKDKEIKIVQESLNKINSMLSKILHKNKKSKN
jgi:hypothetical protein